MFQDTEWSEVATPSPTTCEPEEDHLPEWAPTIDLIEPDPAREDIDDEELNQGLWVFGPQAVGRRRFDDDDDDDYDDDYDDDDDLDDDLDDDFDDDDDDDLDDDVDDDEL